MWSVYSKSQRENDFLMSKSNRKYVVAWVHSFGEVFLLYDVYADANAIKIMKIGQLTKSQDTFDIHTRYFSLNDTLTVKVIHTYTKQ